MLTSASDASDVAAMLRRMVMRPGDLTGKKPRRIEGDRRCPCGTKLMPYNPESLCSLCQRSPRPPKEIVMEPEVWTTKQVKDFLGLDNASLVRTLEDQGFIELASTGRGRWGRKYVADTVRAYAEASTLDHPDSPLPGIDPAVVAGLHLIYSTDSWNDPTEPGVEAERVPGAFDVECPIAASDDCCGQPEACVHAESDGDESRCSCDEGCCPSEPEGARVQFGSGSFWIGAPSIDSEIDAMDSIRQALEPLDNAARERAVRWAIQRFEIGEDARA
jgi:hypothetical protein